MLEAVPIKRGRQPCHTTTLDIPPTLLHRLDRAISGGMTTAANRSELIRWLINESLTKLEQSWIDHEIREAAIRKRLSEAQKG